MLSARAFHRGIEQRWKGASQVAELIDISFRFNRAEVSTRHKGGITSAIQYAAEAPEFDGRYNESALKANWRTYRASSIFLYLICKQQFNFAPPRVSSKLFIDKILDQADSRSEIEDLFIAYGDVHSSLTSKGYSLPKLRLVTGRVSPQLTISPLPAESLSLLRYRS